MSWLGGLPTCKYGYPFWRGVDFPNLHANKNILPNFLYSLVHSFIRSFVHSFIHSSFRFVVIVLSSVFISFIVFVLSASFAAFSLSSGKGAQNREVWVLPWVG